MSSAAVQANSPAVSNRQYPQSSHQRDQYYSAQSGNVASSPQASRKPSRRPSGNGSVPNTPTATQYNQSPSASSASMTTPRAHPLPPSSVHASPAFSGSTTASGPNVPQRTSSHQQSQTRDNTHNTEQFRNMSLDDGQAAGSQSRRQGHSSSGNGSSARTKQSPGHSRSATAVATPPANLPREDSTIINRVITSDPNEDIAREKARQAEARGQAPVDIDASSSGLGLVGSEGVDDGGRGGARRQDHSKSDRRSKETRFGDYILGQTLGEGEFGKVKMGWKKEGGVQVAIKLIRRDALGTNPSRLPKIYREISILRGLQHPNIVRLHEMVETERHIGIILEYASGGELFDYILTHRYLKDNAARRLFAQLVSGVGYLHKRGIVHRDLKLENLMLDRNRNIIITDFGFANTFNPTEDLGDEIEYNLSNRDFVKKMGLEQLRTDGTRRGDLMQTSCGSPCYAAPELVVSDSLYTGRKVDVWSCGVILYAMLAGYLPFDDDPANPEGDNINLLYKYIVSTPLTFPEYVTPHARDLLKRILVPDPRKRADLFEVARHSWLSEFAHVVGFITSSTTTTSDIANTTVPARTSTSVQQPAQTDGFLEDPYEPPMLTRSASVREPTKPQSAHNTTVGGLQKPQGSVDPNAESKTRDPRDAKRRTVQVEYVAPQRETAREHSSPATATSNGTPRTRQRADQGPTEVSATYQSSSRQTAQRSSSGAAPPSSRVASESIAFGSAPHHSAMPTTSNTRPATGGSMGATGRLPSRGNSYGQPAAATVAPTNAQGRFSQPKGKRYVISAPMPQDGGNESAMGRPSTQRMPSHDARQEPTSEHRSSHRRSNTVGGISEKIFGRAPSMFGGRPSVEQGNRENKKYPPTSMAAPIPNDPDAPRQSIESSRRTSFGFNRRSNDTNSKPERQSRRFSLIPNIKNAFGGSSKSQDPPSSSHSADPRRSQAPRSRGQSRPNTTHVAYGSAASRSPSQSTTGSTIPVLYDGNRESPPSQMRESRIAPTSAPSQQTQFSSNYAHYDRDARYYNQANDSEASQPVVGRPQYPAGFNTSETLPSQRDRPGVLQKNRKFAEEQGPAGHGASSNSSRRVTDWFRRIGRQRTREER
ncbi:Pkinase-domain-containing protein [Pseudovirgaria hyperparasitica]|uniref:non-specific serine/threonine protein kinase n=1 Tax=Pseudovirgaria hyperparasitica TaxID=470096 RepID=A0A6A6W7C6_9PEZI|nr:Pkinase-domain-containing protein [Pseudovirgaria hyperparasitica]KAF2758762.1 Pkinase-domain-containing protein [Pseudovirgaria hyperparasitica]